MGDLVRHVMTHNDEPGIEEVVTDYSCKYCGLVLPNVLSLGDHLKNKHTKDIGNKCCYCREIFASYANTMRHIETVHLDIRKHPCPICYHRFTCTRDLRNHARTHQQKQPIQYGEKCNATKSKVSVNDV